MRLEPMWPKLEMISLETVVGKLRGFLRDANINQIKAQ